MLSARKIDEFISAHSTEEIITEQEQGRSDGGYIGIYTPKSVYLKFFYAVVLSP